MAGFGRLGFRLFSLAALGAALLAAPAHGAAPDPTFPLHVDSATRTLVDAAGKPFLVAGDTAWSLVVQLTDPQVEQYLDDRRARGINTVLVNLLEHKFSTNAPANLLGQPPFTTAGDFATPNDAYFTHAEWVVSQARARNMLVMLAPMYLGYLGGDQGWYTELKNNGPAKAQAFGRYVGQRFAKYPNIVWVQGGDTAAVDAANGVDAAAEVDALVAGIAQYDSRLQTAHGARGQSSLDGYNKPWLGLDAIYTSCDDAQAKARAEWLRGGTLPFFHVEGIYENEPVGTPVPAECLLNQMYYTVLLGARGHVFGNRPIWLFDAGWPTALSSTGSQYMQHAVALFRSRDGWGLVPDTDRRIVVAGEGTLDTGDFAAAARTQSGSSVLVYVPTARTLQVDTSQLQGPLTSAKWYDPRTGQEQLIGTFANGAARSFTTPGGAPWLLVLDNPSVFPSQPVWHPFFAVDTLETPYVGDFNGDGKTDIITFTRQNPLAIGDVYVALSNGHEFVDKNGSAGLSDKWHDWFAITTDETVVIGDFDGDGKDDIATWLGRSSRQVYVALSTGTGMTPEHVWLNSIGFDPTDMLLSGDVDGDGKKGPDPLRPQAGQGLRCPFRGQQFRHARHLARVLRGVYLRTSAGRGRERRR